MSLDSKFSSLRDFDDESVFSLLARQEGDFLLFVAEDSGFLHVVAYDQWAQEWTVGMWSPSDVGLVLSRNLIRFLESASLFLAGLVMWRTRFAREGTANALVGSRLMAIPPNVQAPQKQLSEVYLPWGLIVL